MGSLNAYEKLFIALVKSLTSPRRKPGSSVFDVPGFRLSPERRLEYTRAFGGLRGVFARVVNFCYNRFTASVSGTIVVSESYKLPGYP